jgi:hypothetical protein
VERPAWTPEDISLDQPSQARIYDYLLGGAYNSAADREIARQICKAMPDVATVARANRAFLYRTVRFLVDTGIRQFLDLGSGVPTMGNVHEIAQRAAPEARVVYVDVDPVAVAQSRALLAGDDQADVVHADLRDPDRILGSEQARRLLDFDQPVGLLMVAILQVIPDADDPAGVVARFSDRVTAGSHLVIAHPSADSRPDEVGRVREEILARMPTTMTPRTHQQISRFFAGFDLVEPGLVWVAQWRPEPGEEFAEHPERSINYGGVGRKA